MGKLSSIQKSTIIEAALLRALAVREHYNNYYDFINQERLLDETRVLLEGYTKYYELYSGHEAINFDVFLTQFVSHWHSKDMNNDDADWYKEIIQRVASSDKVDGETALLGLVNQQFISNVNKIAEKEFNSEDIRQLLEVYEKNYSGIVHEFDDDAFHIDDIDLSRVDKGKGVPYCFDELQKALGGMIPGSLVTVNAASGQGKSIIVYKQCSHTLQYLKKIKSKQPILLCNTEGTNDVAFTRILSNLYRERLDNGYTDLLDANRLIRVKEHFLTTYGKDALKIFTANHCGINYIRMKIKKYKPALVILDMAAHILTSQNKNSSDASNLESFFNSLRRISSENCPIMVTVQAGNGAKWWDKDEQKYKYKQWPTDDDIYGSKTAVQGASETIITMGRDNENQWTRYIQTTKTKSEETAKFICELNPRYNDFDTAKIGASRQTEYEED